MAVATYTKSGSKATTAAVLDKSIFGLEVNNHELLKQSYLSELANRRANYAKAQTRGDVSGGGRKPWMQKGTGRARFGSSRNPIWRGGGVAFGPTGNEAYKVKLNVKAKRQALRQALSLATQANKLSVIEKLDFSGKTKDAAKLIYKIVPSGLALLVITEADPKTALSTRNLDKGRVKVVQASNLSTLSVIDADHVLIEKPALEILKQRLGTAAKESPNG